MRKFSLKEICSMPVLKQGHFDNLVYESTTKRVWLSRMTIEDGMPFNNQVTIETLVQGKWEIKEQYQPV